MISLALMGYFLAFLILIGVVLGLGLAYEFAWWLLETTAERRWKKERESKERGRL